MTTFNKAGSHASCTDDKFNQTRTEYILKSIREPVIVKGVFFYIYLSLHIQVAKHQVSSLNFPLTLHKVGFLGSS